MSNNNNETDPLAKRREEAAKAMEDDKHRVAKEVKANEKKRRGGGGGGGGEGKGEKRSRELREQLAAHQAAEREKTAEEKQAAIEAEEQAAEQSETEKMEAAEQAANAYEKRVDHIASSKQTIEKLKDQKVMMNPLRTFKSDMARAVKEGGISLSTIAISEQARKRLGLGPAAASDKSRAYLPYVLSALAIIIIGGIIFFWWRSTQITTVPVEANPVSKVPSLIFSDADKTVELVTNLANNRSTLNGEAKNIDGQWTIKNLSFVEDNITLSWQKVAQLLDLKIPEVVARGLNNQYMFGLYRMGTANQRFILLKTSSPDTAFASLLSWEASMPSQILPLFYENPPKISFDNTAFRDKLIRNKDTRVLLGSEKQTILIYGLIDSETIILAPNEETFIGIFDRFAGNQ